MSGFYDRFLRMARNSSQTGLGFCAKRKIYGFLLKPTLGFVRKFIQGLNNFKTEISVGFSLVSVLSQKLRKVI